MTKAEREKIIAAIALFKTDNGWEKAMSILYKLAHGNDPYATLTTSKTVSIFDLYKTGRERQETEE